MSEDHNNPPIDNMKDACAYFLKQLKDHIVLTIKEDQDHWNKKFTEMEGKIQELDDQVAKMNDELITLLEEKSDEEENEL